MNCTLPSAKSLKKIIDLFDGLATTLCLVVDAGGWSIDAMDDAHVAFLLLHLPASAFAEYAVSTNLALGLNRAALAKALKCAGDHDKLQVTHEANGNKVSIASLAPTKGYTRTGTFDVPLIEAERPDVVPAPAQHECAMPLNAAQFAADCKALSSFGDRVTLTASDGLLTLSNERKMRMSQKAAIEWFSPNHDTVSGTYSLKYLNSFAGALALCGTVQIGFSSDTPLHLVYAIEGGGHLTYVLAPKIETN